MSVTTKITKIDLPEQVSNQREYLTRIVAVDATFADGIERTVFIPLCDKCGKPVLHGEAEWDYAKQGEGDADWWNRELALDSKGNTIPTTCRIVHLGCGDQSDDRSLCSWPLYSMALGLDAEWPEGMKREDYRNGLRKR